MDDVLVPIAAGVWTVPAPLRFYGLKVNTRMTVCRLSDGGTLLIAPVQANAALKSCVDRVGPVRAVIAPNLMHHLYLGDWIEAYPAARVYGPAGLATKRPDLRFSGEFDESLDAEVDTRFGGELRRIPIAGIPGLRESLFFHRASKCLIVADFCFFLPEARGLTGLFAKLTGVDKHALCEPSVRILIKDKAAFLESLKPLRTLRIEHLAMCHHSVISEGANEALKLVLDRLKLPDGETV